MQTFIIIILILLLIFVIFIQTKKNEYFDNDLIKRINADKFETRFPGLAMAKFSYDDFSNRPKDDFYNEQDYAYLKSLPTHLHNVYKATIDPITYFGTGP